MHVGDLKVIKYHGWGGGGGVQLARLRVRNCSCKSTFYVGDLQRFPDALTT